MSDISYSVSVRVDKEYLSNQISVSGVTASMSQAGMQSMTYTLTTSAVSISTEGLSSVGLAFMRNLSTATVSTAQIGIDEGGSFVGFVTMRAGEPAVFRMTAGTNYKAIGTPGTRLRVDVTEG